MAARHRMKRRMHRATTRPPRFESSALEASHRFARRRSEPARTTGRNEREVFIRPIFSTPPYTKKQWSHVDEENAARATALGSETDENTIRRNRKHELQRPRRSLRAEKHGSKNKNDNLAVVLEVESREQLGSPSRLLTSFWLQH